MYHNSSNLHTPIPNDSVSDMTYNVAWWDVKPYSTPNHIPNDYFTEIYTN